MKVSYGIWTLCLHREIFTWDKEDQYVDLMSKSHVEPTGYVITVTVNYL